MKLRAKMLSVIIWSDNHEKLAKWYEDVLGFTVREVTTHPDDSCIGFDFGDTYFSVGRHNKVQGKSKDPYRVMVGFPVLSVSAAYEEIKDKDVTWIAKPFESPTGTTWCMTIADPEGNILQFFGQK